jgi:hypothetical protein
MKPRTEEQPTGTQRPDRPDDRDSGRIRDPASDPRSRERSPDTLPADRSANETESTSMGSE